MSKLTKLIKHPVKFFKDSRIFRFGVRSLYKDPNAQEYMNELVQFIKSTDTNAFMLGEEYLWPYLRQRLWVQLYAAGNSKKAKMRMGPGAMQLGRPRDLPFTFRQQAKIEYDACDIEEIKHGEHEIDFLFLSVINSSEQVILDDGRIYHRVTDPIYEIASKIGNTKKIEMLRVKSKNLTRSKNYYHKVMHVIPPYIIKSGFNQAMRVPDDFIPNLKRNIYSINHSRETLRQFIDWELHTRDYYIDLLQRLSPKFLFLNGFHYQAPLISAAHSLGIKTIDIQHGIQVGWNPLYNHWPEMPKEGYQAVVDYFFVWGKKDADSIKRVFGGKKHSAIIAGAPWLERQIELTQPLLAEHAERLSKFKVRVLLILQNQSKMPAIYKKLIENSPPEYAWVIRHHPKGPRLSVDTNGKDNVFISEYFDQVVLAQLFKHIDVVVSEGSTVAAEADYAGLYNFIFGKKGKDNYKQEIKSEHFFAIDTYEEIMEKLAILDFTIRKSRASVYARVNLENILIDMLKAEQNQEI
jgi:hypothetical protein